MVVAHEGNHSAKQNERRKSPVFDGNAQFTPLHTASVSLHPLMSAMGRH